MDKGFGSMLPWRETELYAKYFIIACIVLIVAVLSDFVFKKIILRIIEKIVKKTKAKWDDVFFERKVFASLSHISPAVIIYLSAGLFPFAKGILERIAVVYLVVVIMVVVIKLLDSVEEIYSNLEIAKERPIKGYIQVLQMVIIIIGSIVIISHLLDKPAWKLLSGIGALTAVILLIFKDSILGFVAGIQIAANRMVKIGDWVEMPKYNADGDVIEISLTTVKVRNFDKTITNIPVYAFISDSFKNWRGMSESGARRIKRAINIDVNTIKICSEEMLEKYKKIEYISEYIGDKMGEVEEYNRMRNIDLNEVSNGRRLTNIGTFREYVLSYLKQHPGIRQDLTLLVRQLNPTENGLPIEIYAFSKDIVWKNYESMQADIFDHLLAILPEFELRAFQNPSGNDFEKVF